MNIYIFIIGEIQTKPLLLMYDYKLQNENTVVIMKNRVPAFDSKKLCLRMKNWKEQILRLVK